MDFLEYSPSPRFGEKKRNKVAQTKDRHVLLTLQVARRYGRPIDVKNVLDAQEFLIKGGIDFSAIIR